MGEIWKNEDRWGMVVVGRGGGGVEGQRREEKVGIGTGRRAERGEDVLEERGSKERDKGGSGRRGGEGTENRFLENVAGLKNKNWDFWRGLERW